MAPLVLVTVFAIPAQANDGTPYITRYVQELESGGVGSVLTINVNVPSPGYALATPVLLTSTGVNAQPGCPNPASGQLSITAWYYDHTLSYIEAEYEGSQSCSGMYYAGQQASLSYNGANVDSTIHHECYSGTLAVGNCTGDTVSSSYYAGGGAGRWVEDIYTRAQVPYGWQWDPSSAGGGCTVRTYDFPNDSLSCHVKTPPIYIPENY